MVLLSYFICPLLRKAAAVTVLDVKGPCAKIQSWFEVINGSRLVVSASTSGS